MKNSLVRQAMPPEEEFARRLKNVRAKMEDRGIDVLVVYSGPGSLRFGQRGHVMYLTGYEAILWRHDGHLTSRWKPGHAAGAG